MIKALSITWVLWVLLVIVLSVAFIAFMVWLAIELVDSVKELGIALGKEASAGAECLAHGYPKHKIPVGGQVYCLRTIDGTDEVRLLRELE